MKRTSAIFLLLTAFATFGKAYQGQYFVNRPGIQELSGRMIVRPAPIEKLQKDASFAESLNIRLRARARLEQSALRYYPEVDQYLVQVPAGLGENEYSRLLMATGEYEYAEPDWIVYPVLTPNDPLFSQQWHHPVIQSARAWNITIGSPSVIIAVTDTGIDVTHDDLQNRVPGYNAVDRKTEAQGGQINDLNGHGTHTSGIAAGTGNNAKGIVGAGWNFKLMPIRVSNDAGGGASLDDLTYAARWAADNGAQVVSTSYSGVEDSALQTTGKYLNSKGVSYLYAAGNSADNWSGFDWANVIVVGASDQNDNRAGFSGYGRAVDVFAPGVDILSSVPTNAYGVASGTSMATPLAAGVLALIRARHPSWTVSQVETALFRGAKDLGPSGNDEVYGWGRVDSYNSLLYGGSGNVIRLVPSSVSAYQGTYAGGTLPDVQQLDSRFFDVRSVFIQRLGMVAAIETTYTLDKSVGQLYDVTLSSEMVHNMSVDVATQVFAFNWTANVYDYVGAFTVRRGGGETGNVTISTGLSQYVNGSGEMKFVVRMLAPAFRAGSGTTYLSRMDLQYLGENPK